MSPPAPSEGILVDVIGLTYHCGSVEGFVSHESKYSYEHGTPVTFSIGGLIIGECMGKPLLTISDLLPIETPSFDPKLINRARLLYSLTPAQGFEMPIIVDQKVSFCFIRCF